MYSKDGSSRRQGAIVMAALDFLRALNERPLWVKLLFRIVVGRHAYREFLFIVTNCREDGYDPTMDYGLEFVSYHNDEQPWRWWL
jgi:hypothetical protein